MERKYYFRGLGLGIIVTAVIMGIALSGSRQRQMTDEEIIARAKKLGMIEDSSLLASVDDEETEAEEPGEQENEEAAEPETVKPPVKLDVAVAEQEPAETTEETPEADTESTADTEPDADADAGSSTDTKPAANTRPATNTNEMTKQDDDTTKAASQATSAASSTTSAAVKSVTIVSGDSSYTIAKKLAEAGVVNSAASFDTFLCENGYDKRLRTGTFQIPADAGDEQIARIVTGQE
ncbi:MAG: endolytic transglycosylase MltG [Lachnospiraceae bacterium]|nr:endolytic transglycosylase MltG [Lachnospiraceae bacterium]